MPEIVGYEQRAMRRLAISLLSPEVVGAMRHAFSEYMPEERRANFELLLERKLTPIEEERWADYIMDRMGNLPDDRKRPLLAALDSFLTQKKILN